MLTIVDAPVNGRKTGYMANDSTTYKKGSFIVQSGTFSAGDITSLPAGQKSKPGFARAGDKKLVRAYIGSGGRAFPIDKKFLEVEGSDDDNDTIKAGASCTFYTQGTFQSTEFTDVGSAVFGDFLKMTASGTATIEATPETETGDSVARVEVLFNSDASANKHRLEFTIVSGEA